MKGTGAGRWRGGLVVGVVVVALLSAAAGPALAQDNRGIFAFERDSDLDIGTTNSMSVYDP